MNAARIAQLVLIGLLPAVAAQRSDRRAPPADPAPPRPAPTDPATRDPVEGTPEDSPGATDLEGAVDPLRIVLGSDEEARVASYFSICDHDGNGWIAFREARESLKTDRPAYASFDADFDGRIDAEEFRTRYIAIVDVAGGFAEPTPYAGPRLLPTRNPEQLRAAFDATGDSALELFEIEKLLAVYEREDIPAQIVLAKLDVDASRKLELEELGRLSQLLSATYVESSRESRDLRETADSIEGLFGGLIPRAASEFGQTLHPPRIPGPVSPFRRLDLDHDGLISVEDLATLQRPQTLAIRVGAIVAALDRDENGTVDHAEFQRAIDD